MYEYGITWDNLPQTMTLDEAITHPAYRNYCDNGLEGTCFRWHVIMNDGSYYTGDSSGIGYKCNAVQKLDPVMFHYS